MRRRRVILIGSLALLVTLAGLAWHTANAVALGALTYIDHPALPLPELPSDVRQRVEINNRGATVRAWVLDPPPSVQLRGTIVILHGIRASKLHSLAAARRHVARGYRVVIWDSRGHGESTGRFLTYGVHEAEDLRLLLDRLTQLDWLARPLYLVGTSYGAATAIEYAARDPRVDKVVAITPFASLREVAPAYLHWMLGGAAQLIPAAWVDARIDEAGKIADFDPDHACPRCMAPTVRARVLIIASRDDERIPYAQVQGLVAAFQGRAQLMTVDSVGHVAVGAHHGVAEAVAHFLDAP
jgi:pimeloyl-ACP methyl ester carboxylesterase